MGTIISLSGLSGNLPSDYLLVRLYGYLAILKSGDQVIRLWENAWVEGKGDVGGSEMAWRGRSRCVRGVPSYKGPGKEDKYVSELFHDNEAAANCRGDCIVCERKKGKGKGVGVAQRKGVE